MSDTHISIHVVEERSVEENAKITCMPKMLREGKYKDVTHPLLSFQNFGELADSLGRAIDEIAELPAAVRKLLVISCHGVPLTGGELALQSGETCLIKQFAPLFLQLPVNCTVFVSSCWGGYAANLYSIWAATTAKPFLIGYLVPIDGKHNVEFYKALLEALEASADPDAEIVRLVGEANKRWQSHYLQAAIRVVDRAGRWEPKKGAARLAAETGPRQKYLIVSAQQPPGDSVTLWDGKNYWMASRQELKLRTDENRWPVLNEVVELRPKIRLMPSNSLPVGVLEPANTAKPVANRLKGRLATYLSPYKHCQELPRPQRQDPLAMAEESVGRACRACNWATLRINTEVGPGESTEVRLKAICHRSSCPEHAGPSSGRASPAPSV